MLNNFYFIAFFFNHIDHPNWFISISDSSDRGEPL